MPRIKILIAEDHDIVRDGLKILIGTEPDFEIAGEASDGNQALDLAKKLRPDVVVMDVAMPTCNGLEATRSIRCEVPGCKVLILSAYNDDGLVLRTLDAGAGGYLSKHSAAEELLRAIREVSSGRVFLSASIAQRLRQRSRQAFVRGARQEKQMVITSRETEVLQLIAQGLANKQIAADLGLSIKTIEKHRQAVMQKLDIHDRATLTRYAVERGIVPFLPSAGADAGTSTGATEKCVLSGS